MFRQEKMNSRMMPSGMKIDTKEMILGVIGTLRPAGGVVVAVFGEDHFVVTKVKFHGKTGGQISQAKRIIQGNTRALGHVGIMISNLASGETIQTHLLTSVTVLGGLLSQVGTRGKLFQQMYKIIMQIGEGSLQARSQAGKERRRNSTSLQQNQQIHRKGHQPSVTNQINK